MKVKIYSILLILFFSTTCLGASNHVGRADSAYNAGNFKEAIQLYNSIVDENGTSAPLLFNLGNAYFQEGDYGNAMLCWQRARRLDPSNAEVNSNINYLQNRVEDANKAEMKGKRLKVTPDEPSFFQSVHSAIASDVSSNRWAVIAAVMFVLFVITAALYIFSRNVIARKIGFFGGLCFILCSLVFLVFSFMGAKEINSKDEGVVVAFKVTLLTEPGKDADANKGGVLTKGTRVHVLSEEVDAEGKVTWYKVRLNSDYIGWVAASDMELI